MIKDLDYAMRVIKTTMQNQTVELCYPNYYIVGAGISVPELPSASGIIENCKLKCRELDEKLYKEFECETKEYEKDPMKYYSEWIEFAYPNRIDRSNLIQGVKCKSKDFFRKFDACADFGFREVCKYRFYYELRRQFKACIKLSRNQRIYICRKCNGQSGH